MLGRPLIIKPRFGGSSIGVELVDDLDSARALAEASPLYGAGALVEPFLKGWYDVNVAMRTWPRPQLSAIERPIGRSAPLSYADKYVPDEGMAWRGPRGARRPGPRRRRGPDGPGPGDHDGGRRARRGPPRLHDRRAAVLVNEINTIPGSLARYLWIDPEDPFERLLGDLIEEALARPTGPRWLALMACSAQRGLGGGQAGLVPAVAGPDPAISPRRPPAPARRRPGPGTPSVPGR